MSLCVQYMPALLSWLTFLLHKEQPEVGYARSKNFPGDLVVENSLFHWGGRNTPCRNGGGVCPGVLTRNARFPPVGRQNQNLFISCSIIDIKIQICKVTYIKPAIPYAQHFPEHQTHESLQLYS